MLDLTRLTLDEFRRLVPPLETAFQAHLAPRIWVPEAAAAALVVPTEEPGAPARPPAAAPSPAASSPLLAWMAPSGAAHPQDPLEQTRDDRGKQQGQTVTPVGLLNAAPPRRFLRVTYAGSTHDQRLADATPSPFPAGSRWLQALCCLACMLAQVTSSTPTKQVRGRALARAQKAAHRRSARRRVRIAHVNSRVKRCRIVHDTCRLRKAGVRGLVRELCCAWPHVRVCLIPWQPMV